MMKLLLYRETESLEVNKMKIKEGFILHEIAGNYVVIGVLQNVVNMNGLTTVNEVGAFLWERLEKGATEEELLAAVLAEYDVDAETAKADIKEFLDKLDHHKILER